MKSPETYFNTITNSEQLLSALQAAGISPEVQAVTTRHDYLPVTDLTGFIQSTREFEAAGKATALAEAERFITTHGVENADEIRADAEANWPECPAENGQLIHLHQRWKALSRKKRQQQDDDVRLEQRTGNNGGSPTTLSVETASSYAETPLSRELTKGFAIVRPSCEVGVAPLALEHQVPTEDNQTDLNRWLAHRLTTSRANGATPPDRLALSSLLSASPETDRDWEALKKLLEKRLQGSSVSSWPFLEENPTAPVIFKAPRDMIANEQESATRYAGTGEPFESPLGLDTVHEGPARNQVISSEHISISRDDGPQDINQETLPLDTTRGLQQEMRNIFEQFQDEGQHLRVVVAKQSIIVAEERESFQRIAMAESLRRPTLLPRLSMPVDTIDLVVLDETPRLRLSQTAENELVLELKPTPSDSATIDKEPTLALEPPHEHPNHPDLHRLTGGHATDLDSDTGNFELGAAPRIEQQSAASLRLRSDRPTITSIAAHFAPDGGNRLFADIADRFHPDLTDCRPLSALTKELPVNVTVNISKTAGITFQPRLAALSVAATEGATLQPPHDLLNKEEQMHMITRTPLPVDGAEPAAPPVHRLTDFKQPATIEQTDGKLPA